MKKRNILALAFTLLIVVILWVVYASPTDLQHTAVENGFTTWENELFSFQLPERFYCTKHIHSEQIQDNEYGFFTDGNATFYFAYHNFGASGPEEANQLIDEKRGIYGWTLIRDTIEGVRRKQFYNIDNTNSGWNWSGVYLSDFKKSTKHEILFSLAAFDEDRDAKIETRHRIDETELKQILTSVRLK